MDLDQLLRILQGLRHLALRMNPHITPRTQIHIVGAAISDDPLCTQRTGPDDLKYHGQVLKDIVAQRKGVAWLCV